ncbi:MAG: hypothetical protein EX254_10085 [Flavobacteriaceae bacterium]|nr:MAG: hypothetical protein EX254_10085 [Flavobacteriaceae bacterium]
MFYIVFTTMLLILITIFVSMDMPFNVVFYLTCFGQLMVCVMVYKVLRDNYKTDKTFKDFYEDYPISDT